MVLGLDEKKLLKATDRPTPPENKVESLETVHKRNLTNIFNLINESRDVEKLSAESLVNNPEFLVANQVLENKRKAIFKIFSDVSAQIMNSVEDGNFNYKSAFSDFDNLPADLQKIDDQIGVVKDPELISALSELKKSVASKYNVQEIEYPQTTKGLEVQDNNLDDLRLAA